MSPVLMVRRLSRDRLRSWVSNVQGRRKAEERGGGKRRGVLPSMSLVEEGKGREEEGGGEGQRANRDTLYAEVCVWAHTIASASSLHAVGWASRVRNRSLKMLIFLLSSAAMVALPVVVIYQMASYASETKVVTAIEYRSAASLKYPNITVCNAKFFDVRKFESKPGIITLPFWTFWPFFHKTQKRDVSIWQSSNGMFTKIDRVCRPPRVQPLRGDGQLPADGHGPLPEGVRRVDDLEPAWRRAALCQQDGRV